MAWRQLLHYRPICHRIAPTEIVKTATFRVSLPKQFGLVYPFSSETKAPFLEGYCGSRLTKSPQRREK